MNAFIQFNLNCIAYPFLVIGCLLWLYSMAPVAAAKHIIIKKRSMQMVGTISTFLAAATAVAPIYVPTITREPLWYSRWITAPAFILLLLITFLTWKWRTVDRSFLLQSIALLAPAAGLFRISCFEVRVFAFGGLRFAIYHFTVPPLFYLVPPAICLLHFHFPLDSCNCLRLKRPIISNGKDGFPLDKCRPSLKSQLHFRFNIGAQVSC